MMAIASVRSNNTLLFLLRIGLRYVNFYFPLFTQFFYETQIPRKLTFFFPEKHKKVRKKQQEARMTVFIPQTGGTF